MLQEAHWSVIDTQTNAVATATKAAVAKQRHYLTGLSASCNSTPANALEVVVTDGGVEILRYLVPAAAFAPIDIDFQHPLRCEQNSAVAITVNAAGADISCSVSLRGYTRAG